MGELTALPQPIAGLRGPTSKRKEGGKEREREGREGRWRGDGVSWICL